MAVPDAHTIPDTVRSILHRIREPPPNVPVSIPDIVRSAHMPSSSLITIRHVQFAPQEAVRYFDKALPLSFDLVGEGMDSPDQSDPDEWIDNSEQTQSESVHLQKSGMKLTHLSNPFGLPRYGMEEDVMLAP